MIRSSLQKYTTEVQILFNKSCQGSLYPLYSYTFHVLCSPGKNVALCIFESTESIVFPVFLEKRLISNLFFFMSITVNNRCLMLWAQTGTIPGKLVQHLCGNSVRWTSILGWSPPMSWSTQLCLNKPTGREQQMGTHEHCLSHFRTGIILYNFMLCLLHGNVCTVYLNLFHG